MRAKLSLAVTLALGCAHAAPKTDAATPAPIATTPDDLFRAEKPAPLGQEPAFKPPVPVQSKLANGAKLLVVENHALPLVAVEVAIQTGVDQEPLDKRGLAGFVAQMLLEGTKSRSTIDLEIARERLAAQLDTSGGYEVTSLHLNALKETLPDALALLADVIENPAFRAADVERVRGLLLTSLEAKKGNPAMLARDDFNRLLFGDKNPWGLPAGGTPATVKAITVKDLQKFHQTFFVPGNTVIAVSGDVTASEAEAALNTALAKWKGKAPRPHKAAKLPPAAPRSIVVTDLPTGSQSQVWTGWRGPKATDPDALPLLVANNVLGGLFTSRLNKNLREEKAFTYGVRSRITFYRDVGTVLAGGGIIAKHTAEAVTEFEKELDRLRAGPISDDELGSAKEALIHFLPSKLETNDAVSSAMTELVELGLPLDYYATFPDKIRSVQKSDAMKAVQDCVQPDTWPVVVVGPKSQSFDALQALKLGPVKEVAP